MNAFSDPVFVLFLGFIIFAVLYGLTILYIISKDKGRSLR